MASKTLWVMPVLMTALTAIGGQELSEPHPNCTYFDPSSKQYQQFSGERQRFARSRLTQSVAARLQPTGRGVRPKDASAQTNIIDQLLFQAMAAAGATPAPMTTDQEFIRRVTLDLTGRIPTPDRLVAFLNDTSADKRAALIEELLASPQWVDKWTMFFGDLYLNNSASDQVRRFPDGRNAFYNWIKTSLASGKPYDQMAAELIASKGQDSYTDGTTNWLVGGIVTGGPYQDIWDSQAAQAFDMFLGIAHLNCLLCHTGAGHLDSLSLWGKSTTRQTAWGIASFFSRTTEARTPVDPTNKNVYYWSISDKGKTDYTLNTISGNRPARCKDNIKPANPGQPCPATANVPPVYLDGSTPKAGEPYRTAFARILTSDPQFARASVNYIWAALFGMGIVDPPDQFDLDRLDPNNPPPIPWTLQPSNPQLLIALSQQFIDSGYDVKGLMRLIVNSQAYQLASRYDGQWDATWEPLFARKFVRRLWSEEIHDAVAQATGMIPTYKVAGLGTVNWAMQFPETMGLPDGGAGPVSMFLDAFLRGNRVDQQRKEEASLLQALNMMNDNFVESRIKPSMKAAPNGTAPNLIQANLNQDDTTLINNFFLAVLSRYPNQDEMGESYSSIHGTTGAARVAAAQNLLWALFNKVDFLYNY